MIATEAMLTLLQDVADHVILPRRGHLASGEIDTKAHAHDFVTIADREAEVEITRHLNAAYPQALVLGEEAAAADPGLLDAFSAAAHAFTVDPVDGTRNFVEHSPDFGVMVAELRDGVPVRSWIWLPVHRRGYHAEAGAGAVRVDDAGSSQLPALAPAEDPSSWRLRFGRTPFAAGSLGLRIPSEPTSGACAVDYPDVAEGTVTAVHYGGARPWDHAPGALLLSELGGVVGHSEGTPYDARADRPGLIAAASSRVWETLRAPV